MKTLIRILPYLSTAIMAILCITKCDTQKEVAEKVKVVTKVETVHDTVTKVEIKKIETLIKPKTVVKYDTIIKDSIVVKENVKLNRYKTRLDTDMAYADLEIFTTGKLDSIYGTISFPKVTKEKIITRTKQASGVYGFVKAPLNDRSPVSVGLLYQIKNKMFISTEVGAIPNVRGAAFNIGLGIKL